MKKTKTTLVLILDEDHAATDLPCGCFLKRVEAPSGKVDVQYHQCFLHSRMPLAIETLKTLRASCTEAITGKWDCTGFNPPDGITEDAKEGFQAMIDSIDAVTKRKEGKR